MLSSRGVHTLLHKKSLWLYLILKYLVLFLKARQLVGNCSKKPILQQWQSESVPKAILVQLKVAFPLLFYPSPKKAHEKTHNGMKEFLDLKNSYLSIESNNSQNGGLEDYNIILMETFHMLVPPL